jgi:hypothetical protein
LSIFNFGAVATISLFVRFSLMPRDLKIKPAPLLGAHNRNTDRTQLFRGGDQKAEEKVLYEEITYLYLDLVYCVSYGLITLIILSTTPRIGVHFNSISAHT